MPFGLRHVISGILAGGIPGFRMVLCCFPHRVYGLVCVCVPPFFLFFSVLFMAILWWDDTMLSPLAWICQWTGCQSFLCVVVFWFCFGFVLVVLVCLFCCLLLLVLVVDDDGLLDYVQVLHQFRSWGFRSCLVSLPSPHGLSVHISLTSLPFHTTLTFVALNSRWPQVLIWNYCFCNAIERVKRPGGSHEGVGRKDKPASSWPRKQDPKTSRNMAALKGPRLYARNY